MKKVSKLFAIFISLTLILLIMDLLKFPSFITDVFLSIQTIMFFVLAPIFIIITIIIMVTIFILSK